MAKVEIPGLKATMKTGATAETATEPPVSVVNEPAREAVPPAVPEPQGEPLEGDLDPVLAEAVASQPVIPQPVKPEPESSPPDVEEPPAPGSPSFPAPRRRALGGLVVAGALAVAGAVLTVALGGKHGRANPDPSGTATGAEASGAAYSGFGGGFLDPGELEIAKHFGFGPG